MDELPIIEGASGQQLSFVTFELEVLTAGNVNLSFSSGTGILAWAGNNPLKFNEHEALVELPGGIHEFTVAIERREFKEDALRILLQDAEVSSAQTRLVMGN